MRARPLALSALAAWALACGGTTEGSDAGPDGSSDGSSDTAMNDDLTTGCGQFSSQDFPVDASACVAQLASTTSCQGAVCSWKVEVPCFDDAGVEDASPFVECQKWCSDVAPPNVPPGSFCQPYTTDAGTFATCGGCGI